MPNVEYVFVESGKESVKGAFREIGGEARSAKRDVDAALRSFEQLGRVHRSAGTTAARARAGGGRSGVTSAEREAAADETRRQRQALRDRQSYQERLAKDVAASQQRREREAQREEAKTAKEKQRAQTYQERLAKEVAGTQQRREKETQREQARTAKAQEHALSRHRADLKRQSDERARDRASEHRRSIAFDRAEADVKRKAHTEASQRGKSQASRDMALERERKRINDKSVLTGGIGGQLKGAVIGAGLAVGAVGIGVTGAAARDALRLRELSNRISINSRLAGQAAIDPAVLQKEFESTAIRTPGQTAVGVAEALQGFVTKTGRADVGRQSLGTFATVASASGSDIRDVANAAADLFQKFDITGIEQMQDALAALTFQGKEGAFELRDAAGQFARLSAAASRFGIDKGVTGVKTLGGLTQIARSATGSSEQASTAVEATLRQLIAKSGDIKSDLGVNVFAKGSKSKTRDVRDVLVDVISKSKGSLPALQKIFGEEGIRGVSPLISTFNQASNATVGNEAQKTAAGIAAMREQLRKAIDAPGDWAEVQKDAAQAQQSASAKLTATWERLQSKVGDAVIPMLADLADKFANSPEVVDAFIGTIEVMIDAMKGFILVLEDLGLVKKKVKPPEQIEREKRKEADRLQAEIDQKQKAGVALTSPEMVELVTKRNFLDRQADEAGAEVARQQRIQKIATPEEFAAQYKALGGANQDTRGLTAMFGQNFADVIAQQIQAAPFSAAAASGDAHIAGETASQREFRIAQGQASRETKTQVLGVQSDEEAGKAMTGLAAAAAQAQAALLKIASQGQPSPVGS